MFEFIDRFLNRTTMYRLVFYCLLALAAIAVVLGFLHKLPYGGLQIAASAVFIFAAAIIINFVFAKTFEAPSNPESTYITALILALIIKPGSTAADFIFISWAVVLAIGSKYILAIRKKHLFNPAALGVALTAFAISRSAIWWVGTAWMLPFVAISGILIVRKIKRADMVFSFIFTALLLTLGIGIMRHANISSLSKQALVDTSIWFFSTVMLTEPLTAPPTKKLQIWYGILVGILFTPQIHVGSLYFTPELALLVGNVFAYVVSSKEKLVLKLEQRIRQTPSVYDFVFKPAKPLLFRPGQYMEWTLSHKNSDNRGIRRYFTIASSPTEPELIIGVKFYDPGSTFKKTLAQLQAGGTVVAAQLAGDFVLPNDPRQKLVFIAGGIGITPFRSMLKYLLDTNQARPITLLYSNRSADEIAYKDLFDQAKKNLGINVFYTLTDVETVPAGGNFQTGHFTKEFIAQNVPDFLQSTYMLSGPRAMILGFENTLNELGIPKKQIKTDFFPGFA